VIRLIESSYHRAPLYEKVLAILKEILAFENSEVAVFNTHLIIKTMEYIGIRSSILVSSRIKKDDGLRGQARVIDICSRLGASHYINPIGGQHLYRAAEFKQRRLELMFLESERIKYQQFGALWVGPLSIIDVLMFNKPESIRTMLQAGTVSLAESDGVSTNDGTTVERC
jgi:hypothetical protein